MKKTLYIIVGIFGVIMGSIGAVLPFLPAFPFLLLATYCFGRGSHRLHLWFVQTQLYQKNLDSFVKGKGMTLKAKIKVMILITILLSIGFIMMRAIIFGQIVLALVWLLHLYIFRMRIKTLNLELFIYHKDFQIMEEIPIKEVLALEKKFNAQANFYVKININNQTMEVQAKEPIELKKIEELIKNYGYSLEISLI